MCSLSIKTAQEKKIIPRKPFAVFEGLVNQIAKKATDLYSDVQKAYDSLISKESNKAVLENAKQLRLLAKDFQNFMKVVVEATSGLPVVIPWWLGGEKDEDRYVSEYARGISGRVQDIKKNFLKWIMSQRKPAEEKLWFPSIDDKDRAAKIKNTFVYLVRALQEGVITGKKMDKDAARNKAKEFLIGLGYRDELIAVANNKSLIQTAQTVDVWRNLSQEIKQFYNNYFPQLEKAYEQLAAAWESEKFKKNRELLSNLVLGRGGDPGLLEMGKLFDSIFSTIVENFDKNIEEEKPDVQAVLEKEREEWNKGKEQAGQNKIEGIQKTLEIIKEKVKEWASSKSESVRELATKTKPVADIEYDEQQIDQLIKELEENKEAKSDIDQIEEQEEKAFESLGPIVQDINDIDKTEEPNKEQTQKLETNVSEAVKVFRELSSKVKELHEHKEEKEEIKEKGTAEGVVLDKDFKVLKDKIIETLDLILQKNPDSVEAKQIQDKLKQIEQDYQKTQQVVQKVPETSEVSSETSEEVASPKEEAKATTPKEASFRRLSNKTAQMATITPIDALQNLLNEAKQVAQKVGVSTEVEKPINVDKKLDSMLLEIGENFKTLMNDQVGAVSRILEGLKQENIKFNEEKIIPLIEETVNKFRVAFIKSIDNILRELAKNNKRELAFFRGDAVIQQGVIDEILKSIMANWNALQNELTEKINQGVTVTARLKRLSITTQTTTTQQITAPQQGTQTVQNKDLKQQVQQFVKNYLNRNTIVNMLKDVFKKTIDKNREEIKALIEKEKTETTTKSSSVLIKYFKRRLMHNEI